MVFESLLVDILNRYLRPYVKHLDTSQLKVGVWKGRAKLEKLELKEELFAELDLDVPLKIKKSYIGQLELFIPWKRLTKDPLIVKIEDVYAIVAPDLSVHYNAEAERTRLMKEKAKKIKKLKEASNKLKKKDKDAKKQEKKKKKKKEDDDDDIGASKPDTFTEKLVTNLLKNLIVKVSRIHVRYEDPVTNANTKFSVGMTLDNLELKSTDANWTVQSAVKEATTLVYKLLELNALGVYWEAPAPMLLDLEDTWMKEMKERIFLNSSSSNLTTQYVLWPVSATAKLTLSVKPGGVDLNTPQVQVGVDCDTIALAVREEQFKSALETMDSYEWYSLNRQFWKYRPASPLTEDRRAWWMYAFNAVSEDVRRRLNAWSWKHIKAHRELFHLYQKKYREKVHSVSVSSSLKQELECLEEKLDVSNIMICRKLAKQGKQKPSLKELPPAEPKSPAPTPVAPPQPPPVTPTTPITPLIATLAPTSPPTTATFAQSVGSPPEQGPPKPKPPPSTLIQRPSQGEIAMGGGAKVEVPPAKPAKPSGRVVVETLSVQKKKEKEEKGGFFANLKKKFKTGLDDTNHPAAVTPLPKGPLPPGLVARPAQVTKVQAETEKPSPKRGSIEQSKGASLHLGNVGSPEIGELPDAEVVTERDPEQEEKERREFLLSIGYSEDIELDDLPKEYVAQKITVNLKTVKLDLIGQSQLAQFTATDIGANVALRPSSEGVSVLAGIGSLELTGIPKGDQKTVMLSSCAGSGTGAKLIDLALEINPLNSDKDVIVKASLRPINIIYDAPTVDGLIRALLVRKDINLQEISAAASSGLNELKEQTKARLKSALAAKKKTDLDITLHSPYILVPENGVYSERARLIVVSLGKVVVKTLDDKAPSKDAEDVSKYYDKFLLKLQGMQVLLAKPGDDWLAACNASTSSTLHIVDPTGFEIILEQKIGTADPYLPSTRVKGTLKSFEVKLSDDKLASLISIGGGFPIPPIQDTSAYYNQVALPPTARLLDELYVEPDVETMSLSSLQLGQQDSDQESSTSDTSSLTSALTSGSNSEKLKQVFISALVDVSVETLRLELTKQQPQRGPAEEEEEERLFYVEVSNLSAHVTDGKFDTQGTVSMGGVTILDYITTGPLGKPTQLLKTKLLQDGNFMTVNFVTISAVGEAYAKVYSGLRNSLSVQASSVEMVVNRTTISGAMSLAKSIKPQQSSTRTNRATETVVPGSVAAAASSTAPTTTTSASEKKDFLFDVKFDGISLAMDDCEKKILSTVVKGFEVSGSIQNNQTHVAASMEDLMVYDTSPGAQVYEIVAKTDDSKKMIALEVFDYYKRAQRNPTNLRLSDVALSAVIQRVTTTLSPPFLANVMEFVQHLQLDTSDLRTAAKATASTATATAGAIRESTVRLKLDVTLHAPLLKIPYTARHGKGSVMVDLGEFKLTNSFVGGGDIMEERGLHPLSTNSDAKAILDKMVIQSSAIEVYRLHTSGRSPAEQRSAILEPVGFTARVVRNLTPQIVYFPKADISLNLDVVKFSVSDQDVEALTTVGLASSKISDVISSISTEDIKPEANQEAQVGTKSSEVSAVTVATDSSLSNVKDVSVCFSVRMVTLDLYTADVQLLRACASDTAASVDVFPSHLVVSASVRDVGIFDTHDEANHSYIVSQVNGSDAASSFKLKVYLKQGGALDPLGELVARISQLQLVLPLPFIIRMASFVQNIEIQPDLITNATKAAKDGAKVVQAAAYDHYDKYMLVNVTICAPVVYIPLVGESPQALVVNMGDLNIRNQLTTPLPSVSVDTYSMTLTQFKVSRVLIDLRAQPLDVKAERILLHPFSISVVLDHNLSVERTELPSIGVKLTMSELKIYLGQEEFEVMVATGLGIAGKVADLVPKSHVEEVTGAIHQGLTTQGNARVSEHLESKEPAYTIVSVTSTLDKFQLKIFNEEPHLAFGVKDSMKLPDSCSLTTFQLAGMVLSTSVGSNQNVDLTASMKDITLLDDQGRKKNKKIGDRIIQHYTKNPLVAYSGTSANPIAKVEYHLCDGQHSVSLSMDQLLILTDLDFIFAMKDYFTKVAEYAKAKANVNKSGSRDRDSAIQGSVSATQMRLESSRKKQSTTAVLPRLKVTADIRNFCVAIVESENTEEPQALQLKLSSYFNLQLTETEKKGFFNILNLSIATSSFSDLDKTSSWVLLPTSLMVSMNGPLTGSAMTIDGRMEAIKITLSHPIVLLIIHAVKNLIPEKKVVKVKTPTDLWMAKNLSDMKLWFLSETHHDVALQSQAIEAKEEYFELELVSVELILESESTQKSDGIPILAVNLSASVKVSDWTGKLSMEGDIRCEASYYNERLSLWEPLLEPLEGTKGDKLYPWTIQIKGAKSLPSGPEGKQEEPKFALSLQSTYPLQLTLTVTSLHIIKDLVTAYTKEYGKKLFGSVNIQSLTGAPFTFINKLGTGLMATIRPGPFLKHPQGAESARLSAREPVNMQLLKFNALKSSASVIVQASEPDITAVVAVDGFKAIENVIVNKPGQYYYTLQPDDHMVLSCGLVVDVSVTGIKKTITLRSSMQIKNSCSIKMDLLFLKSKGGFQRMSTIDPDDTYSIPMEAAYEHLFYVLPSGKNMQPVEGSEGFAWFGCDAPDDFRHSVECSPADDDTISNFVNVTCREEQYKNQKQCPTEAFAHHIFQLHPPVVLQSLLPFRISVQLEAVGSTLYTLEPGTWAELYDVNLNREPMILFTFQDGLSGKLRLSKQNSEYSTFTVGKGDTTLEVNVYTERMGYEKFSVYCPYWMVNKTGLTLEYKEGSKIVRHPPEKAIQVFSSGPKSKIQLAAITKLGNHTEWSKSFPIISVGASDCISAKFKETTYQFGVEVHLSQFTLSKIVVLTPYYLIINHTEFNIKIQETDCSSIVGTSAPPGEVTHFWPACDSTMIHVAVDMGRGESTGYSCPFNYKKSDFLVLQLNEPAVALCVEVQETGSSNMITFSNYYPGCLPVLIINHFPDLALLYGQSAKSPRCQPWLLQPQQAVYYTWDDPTDFHYLIRWQLVDAVAKVSHPNVSKVDITKDIGQSFIIKQSPIKTASTSSGLGSWNPEGSIVSISTGTSNEEEDTDFSFGRNKQSGSKRKGYVRSFYIGLQRVLLFTDDSKVDERIKMEASYSLPILAASVTLKAVGLSLIDDTQKRELAYIALMESGVIWQVKKGKKENWKTLSTSINAELEEAYQSGKQEIQQKHLVANIADHNNMTMFEPSDGPLRRTHHEGFHFKFTMSNKDYTIHAKVGYLQVDNQLPFSVYPQLLYPLPPPPTVATSTEPKPLFEASVVLNRADQDNTQSTNTVKHLKYVHVLIQKMAVNADLGFILALVDFFSFKSYDPSFEKEYVKNDVVTYEKTLQEALVTGSTEEFSRLFLDVFHIAPIKVTLSFNIRSVGRNNQQRKSVGDQFVQLFLHSVGIILTSVQEAEMKFSFFHLEYQPQSQKRLVSLFTKHYTTQALFQLHTLIFGLDALGSPITVVRGLAEGTFDLFYEPIKGSVLGPEEFLQGLGIGLKSFLGGTVGGLTGAGAKITGAVGDVFAKLSFDDKFIDKRQQDKTKSTKLGHKLGGFAMNLFEGVTGVVTQPVKGLQKEGAIGLLKGTGKGLVGLLVRPAGGLFDLTSGTLHLVTKKTKVGDIEIEEVRPPRFIGRDGAIRPFIGNKALGQAILVTTDDGKYVDTDFLVGHLDITEKKTKMLLVTDRHLMLVEPRIIKEGWDRLASVHFKHFRSAACVNASTVNLLLKEGATKRKIRDIPLPSRAIAEAACELINKGYAEYSGDLRERIH